MHKKCDNLGIMEKGNMTFKKITNSEQDVLEYIEVEKTAIGDYTYSGIVDFDEAKKQIEENECFNIYDDGVLVGHIEYLIKTPTHAYLGGLVILPEFKNQGIGRKATLAILEIVKDIERVDLVTHPHNSAVIRIFLALGFRIEAWKDNYWGDGQPRLVISKIKNII